MYSKVQKLPRVRGGSYIGNYCFRKKTLYVTINSLNEASSSNSSLTVVESPQKQVYKGSTFVFRYSGGTLLDVTGHSLSSVDKPIIQLTVVIYRTAENGSTLTISTKTTLRVGD